MSEQLEKWLNGEPVHAEQCCPDFSCCRGKDKIAPREQRERFIKAVKDGDRATEMEMLGMFLGNAMAEEKVYVAGLNTNGGEQ